MTLQCSSGREHPARWIVGLVLVLLLGFGASEAAAQDLVAFGPISSIHGFPSWYQDSAGLALEICLDGDGAIGPCAFDPVEPTNPWSVQTGFGAEAFWFLAQSTIDLPSGGMAVLVHAVEAAYFNEVPANGDQFAFGRLRVRIDAPMIGDYRVIHPYGFRDYQVTTTGPGSINETIDVGGLNPDFSGPLRSTLGPFLVDIAYKTGHAYISPAPGNPTKVVGSPFGTNYFRVEGPPDAFTQKILDGAGAVVGSFVQTDLFTIHGRVFQGQVPTVVTIDRSTFSVNDNGSSTIAVWATALPTAQVMLTVGPAELPMLTDDSGKYFAEVTLPAGTTRPTQILVTADNSKADPQSVPNTISGDMQDVVTLAAPIYDIGTGTLGLQAESSADNQVPPPLLTTNDIGGGTTALNNGGTTTVLGMILPPGTIRVDSSALGSDAELVESANPSGNLPPMALDDVASTDNVVSQVPVVIDPTLNDSDPDGALDPSTVQVVTPPATGSVVHNGDGTITYTPALGFAGVETLTYVIRDLLGAFSLPAEIAVTVFGPNDPPIAVDDQAQIQVLVGQPAVATIAVLDNDFDPQGNESIDPTSVQVATPPTDGVAIPNTNGTVTYTANRSFAGLDTFQYTVADDLGAVSNLGTVTIIVLPGTQESITWGKVQYEFQKDQLQVQGTITPAIPGTIVSLSLLHGDDSEDFIEDIPEDPSGRFRFRGAPPVIPVMSDRIKALTSNGNTFITFITFKGVAPQ